MQKKPTITLDEEVYQGLYKIVGRRNIGQFIQVVVRDEAREIEALEWVEGAMPELCRSYSLFVN